MRKDPGVPSPFADTRNCCSHLEEGVFRRAFLLLWKTGVLRPAKNRHVAAPCRLRNTQDRTVAIRTMGDVSAPPPRVLDLIRRCRVDSPRLSRTLHSLS